MCLKGIFCFKNLKGFKLGVFGKTGGLFGKKAWVFLQNHFFWHVWYRVHLKRCFYWRFLQKFRDWDFWGKRWFFSGKCTEIFNKAKKSFYSRKCLNLYNGIRILKTFREWFFWKNRWVVWDKILGFFKTA